MHNFLRNNETIFCVNVGERPLTIYSTYAISQTRLPFFILRILFLSFREHAIASESEAKKVAVPPLLLGKISIP